MVAMILNFFFEKVDQPHELCLFLFFTTTCLLASLTKSSIPFGQREKIFVVFFAADVLMAMTPCAFRAFKTNFYIGHCL